VVRIELIDSGTEVYYDTESPSRLFQQTFTRHKL
jgi:hypothetical protein